MRYKGGPTLVSGKRIKKIDVRFTQDEFDLVHAMEKASVLKKADLIRKKLLFEGQRILLDAKSLMGNLDLVGLELSRAGNNINQLARYANILNRDGRFQLFWLTGFCWNSANTIKSRWIWSD